TVEVGDVRAVVEILRADPRVGVGEVPRAVNPHIADPLGGVTSGEIVREIESKPREARTQRGALNSHGRLLRECPRAGRRNRRGRRARRENLTSGPQCCVQSAGRHYAVLSLGNSPRKRYTCRELAPWRFGNRL